MFKDLGVNKKRILILIAILGILVLFVSGVLVFLNSQPGNPLYDLPVGYYEINKKEQLLPSDMQALRTIEQNTSLSFKELTALQNKILFSSDVVALDNIFASSGNPQATLSTTCRGNSPVLNVDVVRNSANGTNLNPFAYVFAIYKYSPLPGSPSPIWTYIGSYKNMSWSSSAAFGNELAPTLSSSLTHHMDGTIGQLIKGDQYKVNFIFKRDSGSTPQGIETNAVTIPDCSTSIPITTTPNVTYTYIPPTGTLAPVPNISALGGIIYQNCTNNTRSINIGITKSGQLFDQINGVSTGYGNAVFLVYIQKNNDNNRLVAAARSYNSTPSETISLTANTDNRIQLYNSEILNTLSPGDTLTLERIEYTANSISTAGNDLPFTGIIEGTNRSITIENCGSSSYAPPTTTHAPSITPSRTATPTPTPSPLSYLLWQTCTPNGPQILFNIMPNSVFSQYHFSLFQLEKNFGSHWTVVADRIQGPASSQSTTITIGANSDTNISLTPGNYRIANFTLRKFDNPAILNFSTPQNISVLPCVTDNFSVSLIPVCDTYGASRINYSVSGAGTENMQTIFPSGIFAYSFNVYQIDSLGNEQRVGYVRSQVWANPTTEIPLLATRGYTYQIRDFTYYRSPYIGITSGDNPLQTLPNNRFTSVRGSDCISGTQPTVAPTQIPPAPTDSPETTEEVTAPLGDTTAQQAAQPVGNAFSAISQGLSTFSGAGIACRDPINETFNFTDGSASLDIFLNNFSLFANRNTIDGAYYANTQPQGGSSQLNVALSAKDNKPTTLFIAPKFTQNEASQLNEVTMKVYLSAPNLFGAGTNFAENEQTPELQVALSSNYLAPYESQTGVTLLQKTAIAQNINDYRPHTSTFLTRTINPSSDASSSLDSFGELSGINQEMTQTSATDPARTILTYKLTTDQGKKNITITAARVKIADDGTTSEEVINSMTYASDIGAHVPKLILHRPAGDKFSDKFASIGINKIVLETTSNCK